MERRTERPLARLNTGSSRLNLVWSKFTGLFISDILSILSSRSGVPIYFFKYLYQSPVPQIESHKKPIKAEMYDIKWPSKANLVIVVGSSTEQCQFGPASPSYQVILLSGLTSKYQSDWQIEQTTAWYVTGVGHPELLYITRQGTARRGETTGSLSGVITGIYHTITSCKASHTTSLWLLMINLDINNYLEKISIYHWWWSLWVKPILMCYVWLCAGLYSQ